MVNMQFDSRCPRCHSTLVTTMFVNNPYVRDIDAEIFGADGEPVQNYKHRCIKCQHRW